MANYSDLFVIGEESENDSEDDNKNELFLRYNNSNVNESAMYAKLGHTDEDTESAGSSKRYTTNTNQGHLDSNFHNEVSRRRSSSIKPALNRRKSLFEPSYWMEPKPSQYFVWYKVRNLLNKIVSPLFENFNYNSRAAGNFCKMVCQKSTTTVRKKFDWPRYRYVCHVTLFQLYQQGIIVADRSLKFAETDNYAICLFRKKDCIMIITFYGIFQE